MFSLRSNISCEEGSTSWAGGEESVCVWGGGGGGAKGGGGGGGVGGGGGGGGSHQVRAFLKVVIHIWIILIYNFSVWIILLCH